MWHKQSFLFLAVLGAATLAACGRSETPSSGSATSVAESNGAAKGADLSASPDKQADVTLSAASATAAVARPAEKGDVKVLSMKEGLALAQKNNCLACHSIEKKVIGPAWIDVSKRYKGVDGIEDRLVVTVSTGGYGNWGNMPMPALAPDVKEKDIRALVRFILSLAK